MKRLRFAALMLALTALPAVIRADIIGTIVGVVVDGGNNYNWTKVELPGAKCGNGSQYKFFINRTSSNNVLFFFEGGGACWDYETCSGKAGVLGAANPNGIPDDYMQQFKAKYVSPIVNGADPGIPLRSRTDLITKGWNVVYLPYCTGDVHVGNNVVTYTDPTGQQPPLLWNHSGYTNTKSIANFVKTQFPAINKLLVTGFSAGGTATSAAYYLVRRTLNPQKGYMLNDSGPIYLAPNVSYRSRYLHDMIKKSWKLETLYGELPAGFNRDDFGSINQMVAREFPGDQLGYTGYSMDYNYSRFSYERFYAGINEETIHRYWQEDQAKLVSSLNATNNFSYFLPYHRPINESHCSTIITFIGAHACQRMEKKHNWWEYLEWPWGQSYKCYSEFLPMENFLSKFINQNVRVRINEPQNWYNNEDPGMKMVGPILNAAVNG